MTAVPIVLAAILVSKAVTTMDLPYDVVLLGDPVAARDDKIAAVDELTGAGLSAVPLLIERLKDTEDSVFLDDYPVEHGAMNPGETVKTRTTARFMCEFMLYRIIAPEPEAAPVALGARSSKKGLDATRPAGGLELDLDRPPLAWVRDWGGFWAQHKSEPLDVIKRWSALEIDRVWKEAALASTPAKQPTGAVPALPSATTGTAATLASTTAGLLLAAWNDPALPAAREAYVKARATFKDALKDVGKRPAARKILEDAAKKEARLKVHTQHWLAQL